jgi:predicted RNA-binding Zn ribbon-like protein
MVPVNSGLVERTRAIGDLDLLGGDPALDFCNTLGGRREGPWDDEWLGAYPALAGWAAHAGLLPQSAAVRLTAAARRAPEDAAAVLGRARELRETAYRVFAAVANGAQPMRADLAALRDAHREALAHGALAPAGVRLDWRWSGTGELARPLWPVAQAIVDLLRSDRLARLKQCARCRWLYLDASRNHSRRWCSMSHCGTAAKIARRRVRR